MILDLDGLKCKPKLVCVADVAKQASSIQVVAKRTRKFELNQVLTEVTKLLSDSEADYDTVL